MLSDRITRIGASLSRVAAAIFMVAVAATALRAVPPTADLPTPEAPKIAPASSEGEDAISGFKMPAGIVCDLFAAEPQVANPVAFCIDDRGRVIVCESFRQGRGVTDNRKHNQQWLNADLAATSVADREAYHRRLLGDKVGEYMKYDDQIRILEDRDGDGRADHSQVFAKGFNAIVDGTAAGVLTHGNDVFLTCIPHLWRLRDTDRDGQADQRDSLHFGYGVRVAFRGHDSHGLIMGPDGRLYFSIGDRGYNIYTEDRHLFDPASGAVFRCELDGSHLEVVATGLRNPQELAFDEFGNLFTGDNNSDSGDKARWVFVAPGGDTGWRMYYQYLKDRGPFNREKIWHPWNSKETPAYTVPPIANLGDGPSGLVYYPGTGLSDAFRGRFLMCDFRGGPANSGIRSFGVKPQGAFFELTDSQQPFWSILATDLAFAPDGSLYVTDWVNGWEGLGKGRVYRFRAEADGNAKTVAAEVQAFLGADVTEAKSDELAAMLGHADQRVRYKAQFALAARAAVKTLMAAANEGDSLLKRLHGIWGLGQIARGSANNDTWKQLGPLAEDSDAEVRAQVCRTLRDAPALSVPVALIRDRLNDESPRVRYLAGLLAGTHGDATCVEPLRQLLAANADADPILRHGGIMGLAGAVPSATLSGWKSDPNRSVRIAAVVALRKQKSPGVASFLEDPDQQVALEAARAIHDTPIDEAFPSLARLIARPSDDDPLTRRVLNANYRLGIAEPLAMYAATGTLVDRRVDALKMLAEWREPNPRDYVLGDWRPLENRDSQVAAAALRKYLPALLAGPVAVQDATVAAAAALGVKDIVPSLKFLLEDGSQADGRRAQALLALQRIDPKVAFELTPTSYSTGAPALRAAARRVWVTQRPDEGWKHLAEGITSNELIERQDAIAAAAMFGTDNAGDSPRQSKLRQAAVALFSNQMTQLLKGNVPQDTALDVLENAALLNEPTLQRQIGEYQQMVAADDARKHERLLAGGSAEKGRRIFFERTEVSCVRCHQIRDRGGNVGPALTEVAKEKKRDYLLESILEPNKQIAKNFESVRLQTDDGVVLTGIVKNESESVIELMTADGKLLSVDKDSIEARRKGLSAMPEDLAKRLTAFELRDLVEYLSTLK